MWLVENCYNDVKSVLSAFGQQTYFSKYIY